MYQPRLLRLTALVAGLTLCSTGFAAHAAEPDPPPGSGLSVQSIVPTSQTGESQGWLAVLGCTVRIAFADATPVSKDAYELRVRNAMDVETQPPHDVEVTGAGTYALTTDCDSLPPDEAATVLIDEVEGGAVVESAPPTSFTLTAVGHPRNAFNTSVLRDGRWTNVYGETVFVDFADGAWEEGATFDTRIWTSRTRDFTAQDRADNLSGGAAIVDVTGQGAPVTEWSPRLRDVGRWVWYSVLARKDGKAVHLKTFAPEYTAPAPQPVTAWYASMGSRVGLAKVGRTVGITAPRLTAAGRAAGITVSYRWYANGRALFGANRSTYRVLRPLKRKTLSVRAVFRAPGYEPVIRTWSFGRVRR